MWKWLSVICVLLLVSVGYCADSTQISKYDQALKDAQLVRKTSGSLAAAKSLEAALGNDTGEEAEWLRATTILLWMNASEKDRVAQLAKFADSFPASTHASAALLSAGYLVERTGGDPTSQWQRVVHDYPHTSEASRALHRLGRMALRNGDPALAAQLFDQSASVTEATPDAKVESTTQAGYAFIRQYWKTGDHQILREAISRFSDAKSQTKDPARIISTHMGLGEVYLIDGLNDKAAIEYQAALDSETLDPYTRATATFELGCAQFGKNDYIAAIASLDSFLSICKGSTAKEKDAAWKAARPGYAALLAKDADKAAQLCGLDLVPQSMCVKAHALIQLGRLDEAKSLCTEVTTDFPNVACADRAKQLLILCEAMEAK